VVRSVRSPACWNEHYKLVAKKWCLKGGKGVTESLPSPQPRICKTEINTVVHNCCWIRSSGTVPRPCVHCVPFTLVLFLQLLPVASVTAPERSILHSFNFCNPVPGHRLRPSSQLKHLEKFFTALR